MKRIGQLLICSKTFRQLIENDFEIAFEFIAPISTLCDAMKFCFIKLMFHCPTTVSFDMLISETKVTIPG